MVLPSGSDRASANVSTAVRAIYLRLRRAGGLAGGASTSQAHHGAHQPEWQRLRGRPERRVESNPKVLEGPDATEPRGPQGLPHTRGHQVAVHAWGHRDLASRTRGLYPESIRLTRSLRYEDIPGEFQEWVHAFLRQQIPREPR